MNVLCAHRSKYTKMHTRFDLFLVLCSKKKLSLWTDECMDCHKQEMWLVVISLAIYGCPAKYVQLVECLLQSKSFITCIALTK